MYNYSSLVFQLETESSETYYQWMVNVNFELRDVLVEEYMLDLSLYAGQSLKIAFAIATTAGLSEYSSIAIVQVPGMSIVCVTAICPI